MFEKINDYPRKSYHANERSIILPEGKDLKLEITLGSE